jgi:hypothetical protein
VIVVSQEQAGPRSGKGPGSKKPSKSKKARRIERRVARLRKTERLGPDRPTESKAPDTYQGIRAYGYRPDEQRVLLRSTREGERRSVVTSDERAVLLAVYDQVGASWRMLTDVRFKLMALLPPIAAVALIAVVAQAGPFEGLNKWVRVGLAAFGLLATVGLWVYDQRNDELYDDLISRGRRLEFELGVHTGVFLGRPGSQRRGVNHGMATRIVYGVVMSAWLAAGAYASLKL